MVNYSDGLLISQSLNHFKTTGINQSNLNRKLTAQELHDSSEFYFLFRKHVKFILKTLMDKPGVEEALGLDFLEGLIKGGFKKEEVVIISGGRLQGSTFRSTVSMLHSLLNLKFITNQDKWQFKLQACFLAHHLKRNEEMLGISELEFV